MHYVGEIVEWNTIGGSTFKGEVVEIDSNVLIVRLDNGTMKTVEGWNWT